MGERVLDVVNVLTAASVRSEPRHVLRDVFVSRQSGKRAKFGCYVEIRTRNFDAFTVRLVIESPDGELATLALEVVQPLSSLVQFTAERLWHGKLAAGNWALHVYLDGRLASTRVFDATGERP